MPRGNPGGYIDTRNIPNDEIAPQKLSRLKNGRYTRDLIDCLPRFSAQLGNGAATGATGDKNLLITNRGVYEWHVKGTQTILVPVYDLANGRGLDIAQDLTATDGVEYVFGPNIVTANGERGKHNYKIGTDRAFFARVKMFFTDVSGLNPFLFGFRKVQAFAAAHTTYTDYALFRCDGVDIKLATDNDDAGETLVDTTQDLADAAAREFEVRVKQDGTVKFLLDNKAPSVDVTNYVFDNGDVVIPMLWLVHGADVAEVTCLQEFESGYLEPRAE